MNRPKYLNAENFYLDDGAQLEVFELFEHLNISIKRIYFISSKEGKSIRGHHAHTNQDQVFILLFGEAEISLLNQLGKTEQFSIVNKPLFIPRNYWIELSLMENTKVICLATEPYKNLKSVSDKKVFLMKRA